MRRVGVLAVSCLLTACAVRTTLPSATPALLQLSPASLGRGLALQQQLRFSGKGETQSADALLEVDGEAVRLAIQMAGQSVLRLRWDGKHLQQWRADWLSAAVQGERVLGDLQLAWWPLSAINAALPPGWRLQPTATGRQLRYGDEIVTDIRFPTAGQIDIEQHREGFTLTIISLPITDAGS